MGRVDGKVVLVTGGGQGLGEAFVRRLVGEGARVVFTDIQVDKGTALADELGDAAVFVKHDVTVLAEWEDVVAQTESTFGPVNVLVNNAGISINKPIDDMSEAEYRKVIDINQVGVFLGMKAVHPSMKKTQDGSIINVSSLGGLIGRGNLVAYGASKWAVRGMSKVAAVEFGPEGIRVNSLHPGVINTEMIRQDEGAKAVVKPVIDSLPLPRIGEPEDVADVVLFLASDDSTYCTGTEFVVDGGAFAV